MINLCIINGSPRKDKGSSSCLISELLKLFSNDVKVKKYYIDNLMKNKTLLEDVIQCNKIIFVSPLYADCLPSTMLEFMVTFEKFIKDKNHTNIDAYCLINCGFLEGTQNKTAINIFKNYCKRINFNWRFGIGIGGGEFMRGSKDMPIKSFIKKPIYNAFLKLKQDIESNNKSYIDSILTNPRIPKALYSFSGNMGWKSDAKKNNLKIKDLYKKIY